MRERMHVKIVKNRKVNWNSLYEMNTFAKVDR